MDYKRFILVTLIAMVAMMLWNAWQSEHTTPTTLVADKSVVSGISSASEDDASMFPKIMDTETKSVSVESSAAHLNDDEFIQVKTDVLTLAINPKGGNIVQATLTNYPVAVDKPNVPFTLFNNSADTRYVAQSGLVGKGGPDETKVVVYQSEKKNYVLEDGQNSLEVNLYWKNPEGVEFVKTYTFTRQLYNINVGYTVNNKSPNPWAGHLVTQLARKNVPDEAKGIFSINAYFGASISTQKKPYEKITFDDIKKAPLLRNNEGGWIAMQQHYFLSAFIPDQKQENLFYTKVAEDGMYTVGVASPKFSIAPGQSSTVSAILYAGPEIPGQLEKLAPHLNLTVDYGWLWFISVVLFWLLEHIHDVVNNWGWSIILLTVLIKLAFYQLSATSYRSMANMRKVQPKLLALKEKYGEDRQKMTEATMKLYKEEKVNPLGGCLPILVQIPVFIALYWVLIESVELRQAPFIFWIKDLSVKDPYYVLPLLMGISMFIQQKLNPPPPDPTQAKVMMFLPVIFTVLFSGFPAGLVLYWIVNNTLSILQQWYIMQQYEEPSKRKRLAYSKK